MRRPGRTQPRSWLLPLVLALGMGASASAHHPADAVLPAGTRLCMDPASVSLKASGPAANAREAAEEVGASRVYGELAATLDAFGGRGLAIGDCTGTSAYVRMDLTARFLDPGTYLGFPPSTYSLQVALSVGPHAVLTGPDRGAAARASIFGFVASELHSEVDTGQPVERRLEAIARAAAVELGEAHAAASRRPFSPGLSPSLLGASSLVTCIVVAALLVARRRISPIRRQEARKEST